MKITHIRTKENEGRKFCRMPKNFVRRDLSMSWEDFEIIVMEHMLSRFMKVCPHCMKRLRFSSEEA